MPSRTMFRRLLAKMFVRSLGATASNLETLSELQWDERATRQWQQSQLYRLLNHAFNRVPHYRNIGGRVSTPLSPKTAERVLREMPILDRNALQSQFDALTAEDYGKRTYVNKSGGSTGQPVHFLQDGVYRDWNRAVKFLFEQWAGASVGAPKAVLWGSVRDLLYGRETWRFRLIRFLKNETVLNAFKMTDKEMSDYVAILANERPTILQGYANSLYALARFIEEQEILVHSPKAIVSSAGTLFTESRKTIEGAFGAPVFNRYGSREVGDVACECSEHDGLHVVPTHYVEILTEGGEPVKPGETGEIVVTATTNLSMPLIRYRIGDLGKWATARECSCGRCWPRLASIAGRTTDVFWKEDGTAVVPEYFIHMVGVVIAPRGWIRQYQIIQDSLKQMRIRLVEDPIPEGQRRAALHEIKEAIQGAMGQSINISVESVPEIPTLASGKYQYTKSYVQASNRPGERS